MNPSTISCQRVSKRFRYSANRFLSLQNFILRNGTQTDNWSIDAINNVSFTLMPNQWLGIYGPNGSGKSTLLRIVAELLQKDKGEVHCNKTISCFLGLGTGFHPEKTAEENIYFHGLLHGMSKERIIELTEQIIEFAGTESHRKLPIKCYSSGMQLRLGFSAAVHTDADIYLLDEVIAVGDAQFREICEEKLQEMKRSGKAAILVSHDHSQLDRLCDNVLHMEQGSIVRRS